MSLLRTFASLRLTALPGGFLANAGRGLASVAGKASQSSATQNGASQTSVELGKIKTEDAWKSLKNEPRLFAVVSVFGQQFKVSPNDVITFNKLASVEIGDTISLDDVLVVGGVDHTIVGRPLLDNKFVTVRAKVIEHFLGPEVVVFKKKRRKNYRRKRIHEQMMTSLCVTDITINSP